MRSRYWILAPIAVLLAATLVAGCAARGFGPSIAPTPIPSKTLRPTFTPTPAEPTAVPPTATPEVPPTATPEPATPTPEVPPTDTPEPEPPTPEAATLRVTSATANVRSGPGTGFSRLGSAGAGQTFEVTGKNPAGDWWEIDFNGRTAWIYSQMASVARPEIVEVAANLPQPPPTARPVAAAPRPTAAPAQPAPAPAPTYPFASAGASPYPNTNDYLTVRCRTTRDIAAGKGPEAILVVNGPGGSQQKAFGSVLNRANTGMDKTMQYMYNENCKIEMGPPFVAGAYTAFLVDGGGAQISDAITFTAGGDQREFILIWGQR